MKSLSTSVFTSPTRPLPGPENRTFSPTTSTLIFGATESAVVDAQFFKEDVETLGDEIAALGTRLSAIIVTHAHGDHYFGFKKLLERFPSARVVTTAKVAASIETSFARDCSMFSAMFGGEVVIPQSPPSVESVNSITLDEGLVSLLDVEQGDISDSAIVHIPSIETVIAGDVVYNGIHQMLGLSGPKQWVKWIESVDVIERLKPTIVVAGHKKVDARDDDAARILGDTKAYIKDFSAGALDAASADALVAYMVERYPDHGNITTLMFSAHAAIKAKQRQTAVQNS